MSVGRDAAPQDFLRAFERLRPRDETTRRRIASMLGAVPPETSPADDDVAVSEEDASEDTYAAAHLPSPESVGSGKRRTETPGRPVRSSLLPVGHHPSEVPEWLQRRVPLEAVVPPAPALAADAAAPALFAPGQERGILTAALASSVESTELDVELAVNAIARGEELKRLPYLALPSLRRGVQLLLDHGDAMLPFAEDLQRLELALERLIRGDALDVLRFRDCPTRGAGRGARRSWRPYGPGVTPVAGTTVVVATDLGIGTPPGARPASTAQWIAFADAVAHAQCQLVLLVPYPDGDWPEELMGRLRIVHWDRPTTAGQAARAVRDGPQPGGASRHENRRRALDVERLARRAAFAVRVDTALVRRLRLELLPSLDAGAEADVWFGPWVRFRGRQGCVFAPEEAIELRARLIREGAAAYEAAWELTRECHARLPAALRLEEELRYLDHRGTPDARRRARRLTRAAAGAVVHEGAELASWAVRAQAGLSEAQRSRPETEILATAARLRLPDHLDPVAALPAGELPAWVRWLAGRSPPVLFGVRRVENGVELSEPPADDAHELELPLTQPLTVEFVNGGETRRVALRRGATEMVPVGSGSVTLRTLAGAEFELATLPEHPAEASPGSWRTVLIRVGENGGGWRVELFLDDGRDDWLLHPVASELLPDGLAAFDPPPLRGGSSGVDAIRAALLEQAGDSPDFETIGAHLHAVLARGAVGARWDEIVEGKSGYGRQDGVRLLLDVQPEQLSMLPWELMCRGPTRLAADVANPLARVTPAFRADAEPPPIPWPLRVLLVVGSSQNDTIVEAEREIWELTDAFRRMPGLLAFEVLAQPSREQLRARYNELRPHIFHFIGYGSVKDGRAQLELYDAEQAVGFDWSASKIRMDLVGWQPHVAILNACRSTDPGEQQGAWRMSEQFAQLGVPAVIAMQADIRGDSAAAFTGGLYRALIDDMPLDAAVAAGRRAITLLHGEDQRDFALPSLSVSWPPDSVLRMSQLRPSVEWMPRHFTGFVDRTRERARLLRTLGPEADEPGTGDTAQLVAIVGRSQVGKTQLARWFVSATELNSGNAAYVDLDTPGRLPFLEALEAIRDALGGSEEHAERNLRAFERWNAMVAEAGPLERSESPTTEIIDSVFSEFGDALLDAAAKRPLLVVLDHVGGVQPEHWDVICRRLLQPIARRQLAPVRAIAVLSPEQHDAWSMEPVETIGLRPFEPSEWKSIAGQYIRYRFDVPYEDVDARLQQLPVLQSFSWGEVAGLEKLAPVWGWSKFG